MTSSAMADGTSRFFSEGYVEKLRTAADNYATTKTISQAVLNGSAIAINVTLYQQLESISPKNFKDKAVVTGLIWLSVALNIFVIIMSTILAGQEPVKLQPDKTMKTPAAPEAPASPPNGTAEVPSGNEFHIIIGGKARLEILKDLSKEILALRTWIQDPASTVQWIRSAGEGQYASNGTLSHQLKDLRHSVKTPRVTLPSTYEEECLMKDFEDALKMAPPAREGSMNTFISNFKRYLNLYLEMPDADLVGGANSYTLFSAWQHFWNTTIGVVSVLVIILNILIASLAHFPAPTASPSPAPKADFPAVSSY